MEEGMSAFKMLTGKRPLGRPRHRGEDNVGMDFKKQVSLQGIRLTWLRIDITGEPF